VAPEEAAVEDVGPFEVDEGKVEDGGAVGDDEDVLEDCVDDAVGKVRVAFCTLLQNCWATISAFERSVGQPDWTQEKRERVNRVELVVLQKQSTSTKLLHPSADTASPKQLATQGE